jgi:hypothetical protein
VEEVVIRCRDCEGWILEVGDGEMKELLMVYKEQTEADEGGMVGLKALSTIKKVLFSKE